VAPEGSSQKSPPAPAAKRESDFTNAAVVTLFT